MTLLNSQGFVGQLVLISVPWELQIRITFKNQELLKGVSWEVKKGERVGLVGMFHSKCSPSQGAWVTCKCI